MKKRVLVKVKDTSKVSMACGNGCMRPDKGVD